MPQCMLLKIAVLCICVAVVCGYDPEIRATFDASYGAFSADYKHKPAVAPNQRIQRKSFPRVSTKAKGILSIPDRLRVKAKLWINDSPKPILVIFHHDNLAGMSRLDYYTKASLPPQHGSSPISSPRRAYRRYATELHMHSAAVKYWVFHKQPRVPRMCIISELHQVPWAPAQLGRLLRSAVKVGKATMLVEGDGEQECDQYTARWHGKKLQMCGSVAPLPTAHPRPSRPPSQHRTSPTAPREGAVDGVATERPSSTADINTNANTNTNTVTHAKVKVKSRTNASPQYFIPAALSWGAYRVHVVGVEAVDAGTQAADGAEAGAEMESEEQWRRTFDVAVVSPTECSAWGRG